MQSKGKNITLSRALPWLLIILGSLGLICAFILTVDKINLLQNPSYKPICNLNPILSCTSVMNSKQASTFGFENTLIGLAGFAVVITTGIAMLAGAKFKRWYWQGLQVGVTAALLFVHWLIFDSLYVIHALCLFCMATWVIVITTFLYVTLYNLEAGNISLKGKGTKAVMFMRRHHVDILVLWLLIILGLILKEFWYYYGPRLGF
jgi:uncharacterized membrane protein